MGEYYHWRFWKALTCNTLGRLIADQQLSQVFKELSGFGDSPLHDEKPPKNLLLYFVAIREGQRIRD